MEGVALRGWAIQIAGTVASAVPRTEDKTGGYCRDLLTVRRTGLGRGLRSGIGRLSEGQSVRAWLGTMGRRPRCSRGKEMNPARREMTGGLKKCPASAGSLLVWAYSWRRT